MPSILALLILPDNGNEWIKWSEEELILRGKMYWVSFHHCESTNNTSTVSVRIPKSNLLSISSIEDLLLRVAEKGGYDIFSKFSRYD